MRSATRFAIAVHILSLLEVAAGQDLSSEYMAASIGVNPVMVRNTVSLLRQAGLVRTQQGVLGTHMARPAAAITLLDVYRAVEPDDELFAIHARPNPDCPVGANIQATLMHEFGAAQQAMEARLQATSIAQVVGQLHAAQSVE